MHGTGQPVGARLARALGVVGLVGLIWLAALGPGCRTARRAPRRTDERASSVEKATPSRVADNATTKSHAGESTQGPPAGGATADDPVADDHPLPELDVPPPDYAAMYADILRKHASDKAHDLRTELYLALISARLQERTEAPKFRKRASGHFASAIGRIERDGKLDQACIRDFKILRALGQACLAMKRAGLVTPAHDAVIRRAAARALAEFVASKDNGDYNIRLGMVAGYAGLYRYLEGDPRTDLSPVKRRLDEYWALVRETGDLDENASNYTSLGQAFMIELAQLLGREDDLRRSAGFRRMFERLRDVISPTGLHPEYGDSYFGYHNGVACPGVCFVLEYAALAYDDPTFLYPARVLRDAEAVERAGFDGWYRGLGLVGLDLSRRRPAPPQGLSQVTRRRVRPEPEPVIDKLILRTGLAPGSAMVMMDLHANGSHAHTEKGPSIAYYEVEGVPLFHNMGRHGTRSAITGNVVWALPGEQAFPGVWREGEWFTMTIPLAYIKKVGGDEYRLERDVLFRNFQDRNRGVEFLFLDNLRLEGPAGTLLVDGFEDSGSWHSNVKAQPNVELVRCEDRTEGRYSQRVNWSVLGSGFRTRLFEKRRHFTFNGSDYNCLKLDAKYSGARPYMHLRNIGRQIDIADHALEAKVETASAEQRGHDACGEVRYRPYISDGARLVRRMVLTREGYLVVRDELTPSPAMSGWNAGQLWQLYELSGRGPDWFAAADDGAFPSATAGRRRMLVKYCTPGGARAFAEEVVQGYHCPNPKGRKAQRFFTTGSCRKVKGVGATAFAMVVVPVLPDDDPEARASDIEFHRHGRNGTAISIRAGGRLTSVTLGPGEWSVTRPPAR